MSRPVASLSLDLDNRWSYLKTHGDESWREFPSYLSEVVPHILETCDRLDLTITVFVVGQDAELPANAAPLASLGRSRHEVGNHSFHHEPWLHLRSEGEIREELERAGRAIESATGRRPDGFRGPGFSLSRATIKVLSESGYRYDASTLPTFIGPLARAYYLRKAPLSQEERERRGKLFGTFREGFRRIKPYVWGLDGVRTITEIPVTTMPVLRIPFHVTYLLYLAGYSEGLARAYLRTGLALCRVTGVDPSILLHSLDFLGGDEIADLSFFPGMGMKGEHKRRLVERFIEQLGQGRDLTSVGAHVSKLEAGLIPVISSDSLP